MAELGLIFTQDIMTVSNAIEVLMLCPLKKDKTASSTKILVQMFNIK
jgi:hypothetical protein